MASKCEASVSSARRADARWPSDEALVGLMREHQSMSGVARACGLSRPALRDFLRVRPELDARMREWIRPRLTAEERLDNDRRAKREHARRWRAENPDEARRLRRESMARHGVEYRRYWNTYNRLRRAGSAPPTEEGRAYTCIIARDPCAYCGAAQEHVDHIEAIANGGTGDWDNLTPACAPCNRFKQARSLLAFMLERR